MIQKNSRFVFVLILTLTSLSCSLPNTIGNGVNDAITTQPPIPETTVPLVEKTNQPAGVIPNDDPLLGSWTVFQVNNTFLSDMLHDESQTWLGNIIFFHPDSIQLNQDRCLLTTFERVPLPENYQETFPLDLSQYGILEDRVSFVRTNCNDSPFYQFIQLDSYTLLLHWQGSYFWLQPHTINAPQRPIVFSHTNFLQDDMKRNINVQIPQITQDNPASQNFNIAAFALFNDITKNFIAETKNWESPPEQVFAASDLEINYAVHRNDGQYLSILGNVYTYYSGAAHPNMFYITLNYDLITQQVLALEDFFLAGSDYLTFLMNTCITELSSRDIGFFEDSLSTDPVSYQNITFTPAGLMIHFSPYDVASYAAGPQTVLIPYADLDEYLKPAFFPPASP